MATSNQMQMILSCLVDEYGHIDTFSIKDYPLFQILLIEISDFPNLLHSGSNSSRNSSSTKHIFIGLDIKGSKIFI